MDTHNGYKSINDYPELFKVLIYGQLGSGKTQLAAGFPDPAWLDFERSTETLRAIERADIPVERPATIAKAELALAKFIKDPNIKTIVVDTVNTMQAKQLAEWMLNLVNTRKRDDQDIPMQFDYRKSTNMLQRIFTMLHECDKHVVLLSQERSVFEQDSRPPKLLAIRPDLTFRLSELVSQLINVVARLELVPKSIGDPERYLQLNPTGKIVAKNRFGIQQIKIKNPTFDNVFIKKGK